MQMNCIRRCSEELNARHPPALPFDHLTGTDICNAPHDSKIWCGTLEHDRASVAWRTFTFMDIFSDDLPRLIVSFSENMEIDTIVGHLIRMERIASQHGVMILPVIARHKRFSDDTIAKIVHYTGTEEVYLLNPDFALWLGIGNSADYDYQSAVILIANYRVRLVMRDPFAQIPFDEIDSCVEHVTDARA